MKKALVIQSLMAGLPGVLVKEAMALNSLTPDASANVDDGDGGVTMHNNDNKSPESIDNNGIIDSLNRENSIINDERYSSSSTTSSSSNTTTTTTTTGGYFDTFDVHHHGHNNAQSAYYYNNDQNMILNTNYDDDQTYLDLFGERAKELLTQHLIPSTDAECRWDWRTGRCEPYCGCALQFLWGDYHLGRSCRFRQSPPQTHFFMDVSHDGNNEETSWQEAWQEVWQTELTDGTVDPSYLPPLFSTDQPDATKTTSTQDETSTACTLPPESRYIKIMNQLANTLIHSTRVVERFHKIKDASSTTFNTGIEHSRHHWTTMRQKSCEIVKRKVEERAKGRNQPVVLTRQGANWIRRVCGPTGNNGARGMDGDDLIETFGGIPRTDNKSY
ncbi:hypothetical protein ACHAWU_000718 [Discostella pseudostelligera]|uniref:Uncharacterized protein n=1 Tax=Discostella pseudostelligera TaxID=259834 RepID=A0ABD3M9V9_9STRA